MILDFDYVFEACDRPVGPELALGAVVNGRFFTKTLEVAPLGIGLKKLRIGNVDFF
jgi:hypothetical protein